MSTITAENLPVPAMEQSEHATARVKLNIGGREVEVDVVLFTRDLVNAIQEVQRQLRAIGDQNGTIATGLPVAKLVKQ